MATSRVSRVSPAVGCRVEALKRGYGGLETRRSPSAAVPSPRRVLGTFSRSRFSRVVFVVVDSGPFDLRLDHGPDEICRRRVLLFGQRAEKSTLTATRA